MDKLYTIIKISDKKNLNALGSALTFEGLSAKEEDITRIIDWLKKVGAKPIIPLNIYVVEGSTMNKEYNLTRTNVYPDSLNLVSVMLKDIGNLDVICGEPMLEMGGRWFDDIVENNANRERRFKKNEEYSSIYNEYTKARDANEPESLKKVIDEIEECKKNGHEEELIEQDEGLYSQFYNVYKNKDKKKKNKNIESITYSVTNELNRSLIAPHGNDSKYAIIIAMKMRESKIFIGKYFWIQIFYTTTIQENEIKISESEEFGPSYLDWLAIYNGINENKMKELDKKSKLAFILKTTFLSLFKFYKNDKEKIIVLENIQKQLEEDGDKIKIKHKTKKTKKCEVDIYYQILDHSENRMCGAKCFVEYKDLCNNNISTKEYVFNNYKHIDQIMDKITVEDDRVIITPKKTTWASDIIEREGYKTPIEIKIG